jgi:protein-arginine kinase activator protein McsA
MDKKFSKNDQGFVCVKCKTYVKPLIYSSRDHCTKCLTSMHVDVNPGDRKNSCEGILTPIDIQINSKKGYVIVYKCEKCGKQHKNKAAQDDELDAILSVMNKTYLNYLNKILIKE